ncbi:MAG: PDZ domain-containing protein [Acidobacteriota bacterium]
MTRSRVYHLIVLASSILVLLLGGVYRGHLNRQAAAKGEEVRRLDAVLMSEVQQLKAAFQKTREETVQSAARAMSTAPLPWMVSVTAEGTAEKAPETQTYRDDAQVARETDDEAELCGSGILVEDQRYVLTSANVTAVHTRLEVVFEDRSRHKATLVALDDESHLALLRLQRTDRAPTVDGFVVDDPPRAGDWVTTVGLSCSGKRSISLATVSSVHQGAPGESNVWLISEPLPEQDGGAVLSLRGRLAGVSVMLHEPRETRQVCIPTDRALAIARRLRDRSSSPPGGTIGIRVQGLSKAMQDYFSVPEGVIVVDVTKRGPAEKAGLRRGDVVLGVDGEPVTSAERLVERIRRSQSGTPLKLSVLRSGGKRELAVTVASMELVLQANQRADIDLADASLKTGIQITDVRPGSAAYLVGLIPGDRIVEVDGVPVASYNDLSNRRPRSHPDRGQLCLIRRGSRSFYLVVKGWDFAS